MILVTTYINPDLDGFSAALVYAKFLNRTGKPATAGFFGEYQPEVKFVAQKFGINLPAPLENPEAFNQIILVDVSDLSRLDKRLDPKKVIEIIDHRRNSDLSVFPNAKSYIEDIGASATLVIEKFKAENIVVSKELALLLCSAIASHTLNFSAADVTQRDRDVFEWLKEKCDFPLDFVREIFLAKSDLTEEKLGRAIESDLKTFEFSGRKIVIAQLEIVGGDVLIKERSKEILGELAELKEKLNPDFIFLSVVDLEKLIDFFVCQEPETQDLLKAVFGVEFKDSIAKTEKLIRRKGLVLLLQEWLENNSPKG
jgi:manganese-dependent inorganic pyrophosphatase